jgi:predicted DNA binding CopG/RHH family protein
MMIHLNEEEKRIEDEMEQSVPLDAEEREKLDSILNRARKTRAISLRNTEFDLNMLKKRAEKEGMPYQTLINTILRKYVTEQLVDKRELYKTVSMARESEAKYS